MKNKRITDSFNHAFEGILHALHTEKNIRIHMCLAFLALVLSLFFPLNRLGLLVLFSSITLVIMAEMFNTAIETVVDAFTEEYHPLAKIAKDVAAGAVLITALNALLVGYLLFFDQTAPLAFSVWQKMKTSPSHVTFLSFLLVMLVVISTKAILIDRKKITLQGGMPSGHAALAFTLATAIAFLTESFLIATVALIMAFLVAQSRVEGKIHTLWEVLVGSLLGIGLTALVFSIFR